MAAATIRTKRDCSPFCWSRSPRKDKETATAMVLKMDVDLVPRGEGFRSYYITKIEELQLVVAEKSQNLRRLQVNYKNNLRFQLYSS